MDDLYNEKIIRDMFRINFEIDRSVSAYCVKCGFEIYVGDVYKQTKEGITLCCDCVDDFFRLKTKIARKRN